MLWAETIQTFLALPQMLKITSCQPAPRRQLTAGQRVSTKYRKAYLRKLRRREYSKLRAMVPAVAAKDKVSKVGTVFSSAISGAYDNYLLRNWKSTLVG